MGKEIGHIELTSKDLMATKKFYSELFRWKFEMFGDDYAVFRTAQKGVGGGFMLAKKVKPGSATFYVNVDTIPATQQKAKRLGGRILKRRKAIGGGMGYWGTIGDPHGNVIGLWSSEDTSKKGRVKSLRSKLKSLTIRKILSEDREIGNRPMTRGTAKDTDFVNSLFG